MAPTAEQEGQGAHRPRLRRGQPGCRSRACEPARTRGCSCRAWRRPRKFACIETWRSGPMGLESRRLCVRIPYSEPQAALALEAPWPASRGARWRRAAIGASEGRHRGSI
eukprot:2455103-Pyramimonas_sp.AAC.1